MQEELKALEEEADKLLQAQEIQSPAEAAPEDSTEEVRISGFEFLFFHTSSFEDIAVFIAVFLFLFFVIFGFPIFQVCHCKALQCANPSLLHPPVPHVHVCYVPVSTLSSSRGAGWIVSDCCADSVLTARLLRLTLAIVIHCE